MTDWQDISTAPDGELLCWFPSVVGGLFFKDTEVRPGIMKVVQYPVPKWHRKPTKYIKVAPPKEE